MIAAIAKTVAKDGKLLLVAHKREAMFSGLPWPLIEEEVEWFKNEGKRKRIWHNMECFFHVLWVSL